MGLSNEKCKGLLVYIFYGVIRTIDGFIRTFDGVICDILYEIFWVIRFFNVIVILKICGVIKALHEVIRTFNLVISREY